VTIEMISSAAMRMSPLGPKRWFTAAQQEVCNGKPDGRRMTSEPPLLTREHLVE